MPTRRRGGGLYPRMPQFRDAPIDDETALQHTADNEDLDNEDDDPIDLDARYTSSIKAKVARIMTTDHVAEPLDGQPGVGTEPDIITDPFIPGIKPKVPTRSFLYMLKLPENSVASPNNIGAGPAQGFLVTIWLRNGKTRQWGRTSSFMVDFNRWVTSSGDFNGGELYFQFDPSQTNSDGTIEVHVLEQS